MYRVIAPQPQYVYQPIPVNSYTNCMNYTNYYNQPQYQHNHRVVYRDTHYNDQQTAHNRYPVTNYPHTHVHNNIHDNVHTHVNTHTCSQQHDVYCIIFLIIGY